MFRKLYFLFLIPFCLFKPTQANCVIGCDIVPPVVQCTSCDLAVEVNACPNNHISYQLCDYSIRYNFTSRLPVPHNGLHGLQATGNGPVIDFVIVNDIKDMSFTCDASKRTVPSVPENLASQSMSQLNFHTTCRVDVFNNTQLLVEWFVPVRYLVNKNLTLSHLVDGHPFEIDL